MNIPRTLAALSLLLFTTTTVQAEKWENCLTENSSAYIPSNVAISEPAQQTPEEFKRWSGAYIGYFGEGQNALCTRLFVTEVKPDGEIEGTYVWGKHPRFRASHTSVRGQIDSKSGELSFSLSNGRRLKYTFADDGKQVTGESKYRGKKTPVTMIRDSHTP